MGRIMNFANLLDFLTRTDGAPAIYILKAAATAILGMIVLILVSAPFVMAPEGSESELEPIALAVILLAIWPFFSAAVIAALLRVAKQFAPTYWHAAGGAALGFALLLSLLLGLTVGIVYVWPFFIYAVAFLAWQLKSELHAWVMTILIHSAVNLIPVFLV